jgi:hypothetical protein
MSYSIYSEIVNPNGNLLFTLEQLNHSSYTEKTLPVKCLHCGKIYHISRKDYVDFLYGSNRLKYCSLKCAGLNQRKRVTKPCLNCGKSVTKTEKEAILHPNFFCCKSCAASFNNKRRIRKREVRSQQPKSRDELTSARKKLITTLKKVQKQKIKQEQKLKKHKQHSKRCNVCGQTICQYPDICKSCFLKQHNNPSIATKLVNLGFDLSSIGTPRVYQEVFKMFRILRKLYYKLELSTIDIQKIIKAKSARSVELLFKFAGIVRRSSTQSVRIAYKQGKCHKPQVNSKIPYKQGWHTTWENKQVFYRSSYELNYAKSLDEQQIEYNCESPRIVYFDSQRQTERVAIPDFHLLKTNTIVEIKSSFTYNRQEMIDKSNHYKKLGYNFKLILDHKEYDYCPVVVTKYKIA